MRNTHRPAIAVLLTFIGSAGAEEMKMPMHESHGAPSAATVDTAYSRAFAGSMSKMMSDMAVKSTGDPDRDFVLMMMPHHQGAIDMAKVELRYGKDPLLRKLAEDVVAAQEKEIADMRAWLAKAKP